MKIGATIRELRKKNHLSQSRVAKDLQMSRTTITNYENNYSNPDLDTLVALAEYFNVSTDYLLSHATTETSPRKEISPQNKEQLRFWHYFNRLSIEHKDLIIGTMIQMYNEEK